jgi:hypothetical protein
MEILRTRKFYAIIAAVVVISFASITAAYGVLPIPVAHKYVYTVKFVCNTPPGPEGQAVVIGLASGYYWTDINIYNPSVLKSMATITQKLIPAPGPAPIGPVNIPPVPVVLAQDTAMKIDCNTITAAFPTIMGFPVSGFIVLYSNIKLNVVAVYTANSVISGGISVDTVYVQSQAYSP